MGLHHRKLASESSFDCEFYCYNEQSCSLKKNCDECIKNCNTNNTTPSQPTPPPPIYEVNKQSKHFTIPTYLIIIFALIATGFFVLCCYAIYAKFSSPRNRSRRRILSQQQENHDDEFLDEEEHGPMVDHPIWYIRTTGLHQSIITAITVCKYKPGEGLIEGTDCSVCLSEFQEDESLRLLPKCNHAFHLPCIDTWLASHTNCPLCRAPIVNNAARIPSMESNVTDSSSVENSHMGSLENSDDGGSESVNSDVVMSNGVEEEEQVEVEDGIRVVNMKQPRRSVSLDSSAGAKINLALATVLSMESSNGNSKRVGGNMNIVNGVKGSSSRTRYLQSAPSSMKRSRSFNGKHLQSRYSRSKKKSDAPPVRSF
ncbi:putative transcription factor C2H2 family [Lupinus albus]|uniref:RING-type E3 ubiquitin transferase n=1 Tax=Lupinus albus TaxID=3870 RepID=A0A6A4NXC2_LUPAL|nr:putative transcription factor C2H2 family [Lupinus albus]